MWTPTILFPRCELKELPLIALEMADLGKKPLHFKNIPFFGKWNSQIYKCGVQSF